MAMATSTTTLLHRHQQAAEKFLPAVKLVIGGEHRDFGSAGSCDHVNPATGRVQAQIPLAGPAEIDDAVAAARAALPAWRAMPATRRREILFTFGRLIREYRWTEVQVLESGITWDLAERLSDRAANWIEYYAGWADRVEGAVPVNNAEEDFVYTVPEPYGVVAMIITWNAPLLSLAMKLAPALATGNTIVVKPAEFTAFTSVIWMQLARQAGIPDGVINIVPGGPDAGEALVNHPGVDKISFTGGPSTARSIMRSAAESLTPVLFELGGKGGNLIFADADLDAALPYSCQYMFMRSGQGCAFPTRMLVERPIYAEVVERLTKLVPALTVGDPLQPGVLSGPLINENALKRVAGVIEQARIGGEGRLLVGGERLGREYADGYFLENTVFVDVDPASPLAQNEVFGPVLAVIPFDDEEHGVEIANNTVYGLTNYIQTRDHRRVRRLIPQLRSGTVAVNGASSTHHAAPFGGMGYSGIGYEGGRAGLEEFTRIKTVLER